MKGFTMTDENKLGENLTFISGAVRYSDLIYFALQSDGIDTALDPHFYPVTFDDGTWGADITVEWTPVGMTVSRSPLEQMVTISENGDVYCYGSGNESFEKIACDGILPLDRGGPLRNVRNIGNRVYAVGMKRQVYRRDGRDRWVCIDGGVFSTGKEVVGFESVDGFSENDIFAAGWEGEIWHHDGSGWAQHDSPTNLILLDVCCGGDGNVYACGQMGTLMVGINHAWTLVDTDLKENIWSLCWFSNTLFMAAYSGIYQLAGDQIERIDFKDDVPGTFYHLSAADGLLCSIGGKDVMGFDGRSWFRIR